MCLRTRFPGSFLENFIWYALGWKFLLQNLRLICHFVCPFQITAFVFYLTKSKSYLGTGGSAVSTMATKQISLQYSILYIRVLYILRCSELKWTVNTSIVNSEQEELSLGSYIHLTPPAKTWEPFCSLLWIPLWCGLSGTLYNYITLLVVAIQLLTDEERIQLQKFQHLITPLSRHESVYVISINTILLHSVLLVFAFHLSLLYCMRF